MRHLVAATNKKLSLEGKMVSDSTTRAVAAEAWSQLVFSIISNSPPSDMSRNYFYTFAERGFNYLEKQLKRLERYKYKLGTKNIQNRMRYNKLFVQANEGENQHGIEHIRAWARSIKQSTVLQENEDENRQGIEHIRYPLISSKHSELMQTNEDENQQGIEHIRECLRSSKHSQVVQENEDEHQQGNEHFPNSPRSVLYSEVVLANEDEYQQGIEHIQYCLISSKHSEVVQTNEDVNHQGIEHIHDCLRSSKHYHEVELVHEDESHQAIDHIKESPSFFLNSDFLLVNEHENQRGISNNFDCPLSSNHSEMVQKDEDKMHGIEYFQECPKSTVSKVVQTNKDGNQKGIEHIQDTSRLTVHSVLEQANEHVNHIEHIRDSIKSTVSFKPAEFDDFELIKKFRQTAETTELPQAWQEPEDIHQERINYKEAKKLLTLFDELLDLIENGDLLREEKPPLRFQLLKVIKLLHHYGVDTIRRGVQNELEDVNVKSNEKEEDMALYYNKKGLEKDRTGPPKFMNTANVTLLWIVSM
ncbi:hypothetical protein POM88_022213 [Heracleum sosnowskyi]|uniref:Uncharacterized protein n=1 Tax=Heracleum sosnowskyi TaxID=360622 RepID=A0AAD8IHC5_9APIA|nr:hypothetical protein POM88_022213 [Heracleum sosnowskyi]